MQIDLLALPSLPLSERSALPDIPAIYFAIGGGGVLYIGKAWRLSQRWKQNMHHRYHQLSAIGGVRIAWLHVSDRSLLEGIEKACIDYFAPPLNWSEVIYVAGRSISLRSPRQLYEAIKALAEKDMRSVNAELIVLLQEAVAQRQAKSPPPPPA